MWDGDAEAREAASGRAVQEALQIVHQQGHIHSICAGVLEGAVMYERTPTVRYWVANDPKHLQGVDSAQPARSPCSESSRQAAHITERKGTARYMLTRH